MMKKMNAVPHNVSGGKIEQYLDWYFIINERTGKACYATRNPDYANYVDEQINTSRQQVKAKRRTQHKIPQPKIPFLLNSIDDVK